VNALRRVAHGENAIDFQKWWKRGLVFSAVLVLISIASLATRGLNLGIDFEGGTSWEVSAPGVSVSDARDSLEGVGQAQAKIQIVGSDVVRVQVDTSDAETQEQVRQVLAERAGVDAAEVSVSTVGPTWGDEITDSAVRALVIFLIVILIYLSVRLEWQMAVATIVAMLHDIIISVGVYSIFHFEVTPGTVIAFLTLLGYSIYDTIVVFDKVKENESKVGVANRMTYSDMVSLSMNQVLIRSLNTTIVAILPVLSILLVGAQLMGAVTLQEFGLALFVGMLVGAYSSIFVAAPVASRIREREAKYRSIRERVAGIRASESPVDGVAAEPVAATGTAATKSASAGSASGTPPTSGGTPMTTAIPPRPRKKTKGKRR
jgi:preprotein translocase subunit SecF